MNPHTPLAALDLVQGFAVALFGGGFAAWLMKWGLRKYLQLPADSNIDQHTGKRIPAWITGALERVFFTTAVAYDLSGVVVAMVGWLTLKLVTNWNRVMPEASPLQKWRAFTSLLAGLVSVWFAVVGGLIGRGQIW